MANLQQPHAMHSAHIARISCKRDAEDGERLSNRDILSNYYYRLRGIFDFGTLTFYHLSCFCVDLQINKMKIGYLIN